MVVSSQNPYGRALLVRHPMVKNKAVLAMMLYPKLSNTAMLNLYI